MATAFSSHIEQLKQEFCSTNAHLSDLQRQHLWLQTISTLPSDGSSYHPMADHIPRSMSYSTPDMNHFSVSDFGFMDRVQSAPAAPAMARSQSALDANTALQRCNSSTASWQSACDDQQNAYAIYSESAQKQPLQPIAEPALAENTVEYTPADYVTNFIEPPSSPSHPLSLAQNPRQLHVQLTPTPQWSPSLDPSTSPSTPSTALMTPVTQANDMSRQGSYNPLFFDDLSMMQSDSSSIFPILSEDGTFSFSVDSKNINHRVDNPHFLSHFTGPSSEAFLSSVSPVSVSTASVSALASSQYEPDLAEDMKRSASTSSESNASSTSTPSNASRHERRGREINAQAGRCRIAPKATLGNATTESVPSNAQMVRIQSKDGSSKHVGVIAKTAYVRPQHPKIMCRHCNERPDGFRGTHELDRHVARAHTAVRKGFICIDASADKKFLANCKHCRNKKVYGAYYNAAAHLRRAHFHPRKRGRKGKHDEKRGGIGGGDHPPMDYLKQHWIRDIEVENKVTNVQSPESASDSAEPTDLNNYDASAYDIDLSYQTAPQPTSNASIPMNINPQYVDYSMCMTEPDPSFNAMMYNTTNAPSTMSDINDFQFDAYRTQ
ncbi:hypothetical protein P280DRAFT_460344 [Massarina eburnea CBS 473.64]|uniref:DUF7896 domain-containing protein n=1 Tax=Massarina eburnea CBS 473.64 TaxID=1395130 RepID=A0A6A6RLK8_9PLEO|nr:hypothetical protein P280DRAFT_460344 [Massarina eburnea CBS 473.64]